MFEKYNIIKKLRDDFLEKAREKYKGVYSYPHIFTEFQNSNSYITVICNKHHTTYKTKAVAHLKYSGCKMCMKEIMRVPLEEVLRRFKKVHGDRYDYSEVNYVDCNTKIKIICPKHGPFYQKPSHHMLGQRCIECYKEDNNIQPGVKRKSSQESFIYWKKKLEVKFPNLTVDLTNVKSMDDIVKVVCKFHGPFEKCLHTLLKPNDPGCKFCSRNSEEKRNAYIIKARAKHGDLFDYSKLDMNDQNPIFICKKHNIEFRQRRDGHLRYNGCPECYKESKAMTNEEFINRANKIHNNKYSYDKCRYETLDKKVIITCPVHGDFIAIAGEHIRNPKRSRKPIGCIKCDCKSETENAVIDYLTKLGIEYIYQYKLPQYYFRWDFVIEDIKLNIEVDGKSHTYRCSSTLYDPVKEEIIKKLGYEVLRIPDVDTNLSLDLLKIELSNRIKYIRDKKCFKDFLSFKKYYNLSDDVNPNDYKQYLFNAYNY